MMEYMEAGTMSDVIKYFGLWGEDDLVVVMVMLVDGLYYLYMKLSVVY